MMVRMPTCVSDLRKFLGMAYLLRKKKTVVFGIAKKKAFREAKEALVHCLTKKKRQTSVSADQMPQLMVLKLFSCRSRLVRKTSLLHTYYQK